MEELLNTQVTVGLLIKIWFAYFIGSMIFAFLKGIKKGIDNDKKQ